MDAQEEAGAAGGRGRQADVDFVFTEKGQAFLPVFQKVGILGEGQFYHGISFGSASGCFLLPRQ